MRRNPREYFAIMDSARVEVGNGLYAHFELVSCKCVDAYVRHKANANQICWKWRKVRRNSLSPFVLVF